MEANETFNVVLSNATNGATISDSQGVGTITNDDGAAIAGSVSINDVTISEGNSGTKVATFTVTRSGGTAAFDVNFATSDGTATVADSDYVAASNTLHFGANENTQTISVTINGDTKVEANETFNVVLSNATNGATISDGQGVGTITNDDAAFNQPDLTTSNFSVAETMVEPGQSITISYQLNNIGTAAAVGFDVGFYISTDATIDTSDEIFAYQPIASQAANSMTTHTGTAPLPTDLAPGITYYVGTIADNTNLITNEINEDNNASIPARITVAVHGVTINGTSAINTIDATHGIGGVFPTAGNDTINGFAGNDFLSGLGGNDIINGGAGNDTMNGGAGNDTLNGGGGKDTYNGGNGDDIFQIFGTNDQADIVNGGADTDTI